MIVTNNQRKSGGRGGYRPGAGRKKGQPNKVNAELKALANQYTDEALQTLVKAMRGKADGQQAKAADMILDRGHGKPKQATEHSGPEGGPIMLSETERAQRLIRLLERAAS